MESTGKREKETFSCQQSVSRAVTSKSSVTSPNVSKLIFVNELVT